MKILTKFLTVPASNEVREIEVAQLWEVRWTSRDGSYSGETQPEMEGFPSRQAAEEFAESLRNAFALIRTTAENKVTVRAAGGGRVSQLFTGTR
jgi:hypothetical protein